MRFLARHFLATENYLHYLYFTWVSLMSSDQIFRDKYGPWAIVSGSTCGIGEALATQLADKGLNLVLVARREELLQQKADILEDKYPIKTKRLCLDLSQPNSTELLEQATKDVEIGLLVVNAALEFHGEFLEKSLDAHQQLLQVNVNSPMQMARVFGEKMLRAGRGGMLFVSSMGGYSPQPYIAHYGASKAYLSSLGEALHHELKDKGVDVTVLAAGLTDTPMGAPYRVMKMKLMSPEDVARTGLKALGKTPLAVPGLFNNIMLVFLSRFLPRKLSPALTASMLKKSLLKNS
jgi:short-subunit dehydrogenase